MPDQATASRSARSSPVPTASSSKKPVFRAPAFGSSAPARPTQTSQRAGTETPLDSEFLLNKRLRAQRIAERTEIEKAKRKGKEKEQAQVAPGDSETEVAVQLTQVDSTEEEQPTTVNPLEEQPPVEKPVEAPVDTGDSDLELAFQLFQFFEKENEQQQTVYLVKEQERVESPTKEKEQVKMTQWSEEKDPEVTKLPEGKEGELEPLLNKDMPSLLKKNHLDLEVVDASRIIRYFELLEHALGAAKVETDRVKKYWATIYISDINIRNQWRSLHQYKTGKYSEFKNAVFTMYPETEELLKGSQSNLVRIFGRYSNLTARDIDRLSQLVLSATSEIQRLEAAAENDDSLRVDNSTIIAMFWECLSPEFASSLYQRLSQFVGQGKKEDIDKLDIRGSRPLEYEFTWSQVMKVAQILARESSGSKFNDRPLLAGKTTRSISSNPVRSYNEPPPTFRNLEIKSEPTETYITKQMLEERDAALKQEITHKFEEQMGLMKHESKKEFISISDKLNVLMNMHGQSGRTNEPPPQMQPRTILQRPTQGNLWGSGGNNSQGPWTCYFCKGAGHVIKNCFEKARLEREGKIYQKGNEIFLSHNHEKVDLWMGNPNDPSPKERVERAVNTRAVNFQGMDHGDFDPNMGYGVNAVFTDEYVTKQELWGMQDSIQKLLAQNQNMQQRQTMPQQYVQAAPQYGFMQGVPPMQPMGYQNFASQQPPAPQTQGTPQTPNSSSPDTSNMMQAMFKQFMQEQFEQMVGRDQSKSGF